jgi:2-keto-3-deoxy-6-phosphogluconate aldolase
LVAVIHAENPNQAERIAEACALGGVGALEITFTVPKANRVIEHLAKQVSNQILLGAGTALDPETARIASAGSVAVGVGSNLAAGVKTGDFASITPLARQFMGKIKKARGQ